MTSWIWMKGIDVAIADPIPPVNEQDKRPAVKDLIQEHRDKIDELKAELQTDPLYDATKHDDLWILRFLMSHKKTKHALKAAKFTLELRSEHKLDNHDIRYVDVNSPDCPCEPLKRYLKCAQPDYFQLSLPDVRLGVVAYIHYKQLDQFRVVEEVDEDDLMPFILYTSEWSHQWNDYVTRTTGRLTKYIRLVDTGGFKFASFSNECTKREGKASAATEDCYPQAMQAIFICDPPTWAAAVWKVVKLLVPKRVREKVDFLYPATNEKERARLYGYISRENLPERYGGAHEGWPVELALPTTN